MFRDELRPLVKYLAQADTLVCREVKRLIDIGDWFTLVHTKVDPKLYGNAYEYFLDAQAVAWLSKHSELPTNIDCREAAIKGHFSSEKHCWLTNERLRPYLENGPFQGPSDMRIWEFISDVKKVVAETLGNLPSFLDLKFGPGATLSDKGQWVTIGNKMSSQISFTPRLANAESFLRSNLPLRWWAAGGCQDFRVARSARYTTVPKKATTDRGIEIQPSGNIAFQLALGSVMKRRLQKIGLLCTMDHGGFEAQQFHRELACQASIDGQQATIDLKSASDSIAKVLVKLLLPTEWFELLDLLRSPMLEIDGKEYVLERFSSMGNGFTFELETLIFYAIATVASSHKGFVSCYGDDLIVDSAYAKDVIAALRFFGFETNPSKTFVDGPFRESCGGDYFNGVDVRPFYLEGTVNEPQQWIAYCNGLFRARHRCNSDAYPIQALHRAWLSCQDNLPTAIRQCRGPQTLGDLVLHDEPSRHSCKLRRGYRWYRCYRPVLTDGVGWDRFCGNTQLAVALYGTRLAKVGRKRTLGMAFRNGVMGYKVGWVPG